MYLGRSRLEKRVSDILNIGGEEMGCTKIPLVFGCPLVLIPKILVSVLVTASVDCTGALAVPNDLPGDGLTGLLTLNSPGPGSPVASGVCCSVCPADSALTSVFLASSSVIVALNLDHYPLFRCCHYCILRS